MKELAGVRMLQVMDTWPHTIQIMESYVLTDQELASWKLIHNHIIVKIGFHKESYFFLLINHNIKEMVLIYKNYINWQNIEFLILRSAKYKAHSKALHG